MKKNLFFGLGLLAATASFTQKNKHIEIPFTMDRNLVIIKVQIAKNTTHNFIFDTGTEGIMLSDSIAGRYKVSALDTIVTPTGAFAGTQEKVLIPKIRFGALTLKKKNAIKMPRQMIFSNKVAGIIGIQAFMGYMITLDYKNSKIILQKGSLQGQPNIIPINLDHLLEATVILNNKPVLAHFDCGAAGYISVPKSWDSIYKLRTEPVFLTKGRTPMGDFDVFKTELDGEIEVGNYKIANPKINLVTGGFFYSVNFGYGFFKDHLITIDTKNRLMQILPE
ncbi:MAG: aspartyl protease family protein [Dinghuibacter sp.]|nr:aspartyl protease family protein [Dinghuibacter sp.]